jgi:hypothetical protein
MPGHCGNKNKDNLFGYFDNIAKEKGIYYLDQTTDDYFGCMGLQFPPSGAVLRSIE